VYQKNLKVIEFFAAHDRPVCKVLEKAVCAFGNCLSRAFEFAPEKTEETWLLSTRQKFAVHQ